jgi:hypothetical protein
VYISVSRVLMGVHISCCLQIAAVGLPWAAGLAVPAAELIQDRGRRRQSGSLPLGVSNAASCCQRRFAAAPLRSKAW